MSVTDRQPPASTEPVDAARQRKRDVRLAVLVATPSVLLTAGVTWFARMDPMWGDAIQAGGSVGALCVPVGGLVWAYARRRR